MPEEINSETQAQLEYFAFRVNADMEFRKNAVAAVLANEITKQEFIAKLAEMGQTTHVTEGVQLISPTTISYKLKPIEDRLSISVTSGTAPPPSTGTTGGGGVQLTLLGYNGDWVGLLPEAAKIIRYIPVGCVITALTHTLFGTKVGLLILAALLAPK